MGHIVFITSYIYILCKFILKKNNLRKSVLKKMNKKTIFLFIFCGVNAVLASCLFVYLLRSKDVSYIVPHTSSLLIICTLIIGYLFYEEEITKKKIIGIILIILGLTCINLKDKKAITQSNV